jgi:hypothetical protein
MFSDRKGHVEGKVEEWRWGVDSGRAEMMKRRRKTRFEKRKKSREEVKRSKEQQKAHWAASACWWDRAVDEAIHKQPIFGDRASHGTKPLVYTCAELISATVWSQMGSHCTPYI